MYPSMYGVIAVLILLVTCSVVTYCSVKLYISLQKRLNGVLEPIEEYVSVPPSQHLIDAGMGMLATLGAKNLAEQGFNKQQIGQITMAKRGFNEIGNRVGQGMGLDQIVGMLGGGQQEEQQGGFDLQSMIMNFLGSKLQGVVGEQTGAVTKTVGKAVDDIWKQ